MPLAHARNRPPADDVSSGARLVSTDGRTLPLAATSLEVDAKAGLARTTLRQTFRNPHDEPLRVTYLLPLPADGAVSGFAFTIGDERIVGQVDTKQKARERFEDAILQGRTAALLEQERTSVFKQEVGNIPPRAEVVCEVQVDQKLAWLAEGAWEWRFPTVVAPRYQGAAGRVPDAPKLVVDVAGTVPAVTASLALSIRDTFAGPARPHSPSHSLHTEAAEGRIAVAFADDRGAALDRDVVVRWNVATLRVGATLDTARTTTGPSDRAYGLLTLVPPVAEAKARAISRDLIVLLDTSGSMSGDPLDQARRIVSALVDSLGGHDRLELIEFSDAARRWKKEPVPATAANRKAAQAWLAKLRASGCTEMHHAILEALAPLRAESQRQVLLITDGLISFEDEIIATIAHKLPAASRVHVVGIGSGVNRTLTQSASRAGRGVEVLLGLGEDPEPACRRLLARTDRPLVTDVEVSGTALAGAATTRVPDLYGASPALVPLQLAPAGGSLVVRGRTADGTFEQSLTVAPLDTGTGNAALAALFARESVEEHELAIAAGEDKARHDKEIERLGLEFQVSTRLTSWVAVSTKQTVDPRAPHRAETMPHALPHGMSAEGVGLRAASMPSMPPAMMAAIPTMARAAGIGGAPSGPPRPMPAPPPPPSDDRFERAAMLSLEDFEPDGGSADEEAGAPVPPPAPSPSPAKKQRKAGSLADFARSLFTKEKRAEAAPSGRRLHARIVRRADGRLVIEIEVRGGPVAWKPGTEARVTFIDGRTLTVRVDTSVGTGPGTYADGLRLTLALRVADPADVTEVRVGDGPDALFLDL